MAKKQKKKRRTQKSVVTQLMDEKKVSAKLQKAKEIAEEKLADMREQRDEQRRAYGKLSKANERMLRQLGEQNDRIEEMYRESYRLVCCLTATREQWQEAEAKIATNQKPFTVQVRMRSHDDCDEGEASGGKWSMTESALNDGP